MRCTVSRRARPSRTSSGPIRWWSPHAQPPPGRALRGPWRAPACAAWSGHPLHQDEVSRARLAPDRRELLVVLAVVPAVRLLDRGELDDDGPLGVPGALDALRRAAPDDEPPLVWIEA